MPEFARRVLHLLIVGASEDAASSFVDELQRAGSAVTAQRVDTLEAMRAALEQGEWDVMILDHPLPAFEASKTLETAKELRPEIPFIVVSGGIDIQQAVSLMRAGAHGYIRKDELPLLGPMIKRGLEEIELRRRHQQVEDELRVSEEKFYKAFHNWPDSLNLNRLADGVYLEVNAGFERVSGYRAEEVIGKSSIELNIWGDSADRAWLGTKLLEEGEFSEIESVLRNKQGDLFPAIMSARLLTINGEKCVLAFSRDISEQRRAEEEISRQHRELQAAYQVIQQHAEALEERVAERTAQLAAANQELESFASMAAHDLRAPLRAIGAYSQILQDDHAEKFDEDGRACLEHIVEAMRRMQQLIDDLLRFSRLSRAALNVDELDLSALAQTVVEELRQRDAERRVECIIAENLWAQGDLSLLRTVLENLLGNAWKFTAQRAQAQIEFGRRETLDETVYFVRDNGAGFDPQYAGRLFEAFQRLHSEAEFSGTGMGLASVRRIIQRHGGRVWAEGQVDQGATFFFTLE